MEKNITKNVSICLSESLCYRAEKVTVNPLYCNLKFLKKMHIYNCRLKYLGGKKIILISNQIERIPVISLSKFWMFQNLNFSGLKKCLRDHAWRIPLQYGNIKWCYEGHVEESSQTYPSGICLEIQERILSYVHSLDWGTVSLWGLFDFKCNLTGKAGGGKREKIYLFSHLGGESSWQWWPCHPHK